MKHLESVGYGAHSHEEVWNLVLGLTPELNKLALDLLPSIKEYKRLMILIGASALQEDSRESVARLANELALATGHSARRIAIHYSDARNDVLIRQIIRQTQILGSQATLVVIQGMNIENARSLRIAYRALRNSCTALWQFEFAPEGNPLTLVGGRA